MYCFIKCAPLNSNSPPKQSPERSTKVEMVDERISRQSLDERGWSEDRRKFFMETDYSKYVPDWMQKTFIAKDATMGLAGMTRDLIVYMYGEPNKSKGDSVWSYIGEHYQNLLVLKFNSNNQVIEWDFAPSK